MKQILFIPLVSLFLLCSCQEQKKVTMRSFDRVESIKGILYDYQPIIQYPGGGIDIIEDRALVLAGANRGEHLALVLDIEDGTELSGIGTTGGGPYELMMSVICGTSEKDKTISFYDPNLWKEVTFAYDDNFNFTPIEEYSYVQNKHPHYTNLYNLENYKATTALFSTRDSLERIHTLLNKNTSEMLTYFGDNSLRNQVTGKPIGRYGFVDGYENDFVVGIQDFGYLAYYTVKDGVPQLKWEYYLEKPIYDSHGFLEMRDLSDGINDVQITKNYLFSNYSGLKHSEKARRSEQGDEPRQIFVFDRDGNPIVKLETDRNVSRFAVSDDEKTIYAVSTTPEFEVMRYDISDIL